jgi:hypothetical protein
MVKKINGKWRARENVISSIIDVSQGTAISIYISTLPIPKPDPPTAQCTVFSTTAFLRSLASHKLAHRTHLPRMDDIHDMVNIAFSFTNGPETLSTP